VIGERDGLSVTGRSVGSLVAIINVSVGLLVAGNSLFEGSLVGLFVCG